LIAAVLIAVMVPPSKDGHEPTNLYEPAA